MAIDKAIAGVNRFSSADLMDFAETLLLAAGLCEDMAKVVARVLVEGDLLGHDTHGLALLPGYLDELVKGTMARGGEVEVVNDAGTAITWDGKRLPGPWLVSKALELGMARAKNYGSITLAIRRSHHIACLAAYLKEVADRGYVALIASSDPSVESVAPFGGTKRIITPNPLAAALPTSGEPILLDISMSTITNGMVSRAFKEKRPLPDAWVLDSEGQATDDPSAFFGDPPGSILPLGGLQLGYKGFGLGLLIEALTAGLGGHGRADPKEGWGAAVFVQVLDPERFAGLASFRRQMDYLVAAIANNPRARGRRHGARAPGHQGLQRRADQLRNGVVLHEVIVPALLPWCERFSLKLPRPIRP